MLQMQIDDRVGGRTVYRLVPDGSVLVLVPDEIRRCVAFLGCKKAMADEPRFGGTAFFVWMPLNSHTGSGILYLVTAKHNIEDIKELSVDDVVYLRMNFRGSGAQYVRTKVSDWIIHPQDQSVDVAVLPFRAEQWMDFLAYPTGSFVDRDVIKNEGIGLGDEVFITGLFTGHYGGLRNIPLIRIGNISCFPEEPVETDRYGPMEACLIEARSIGGLSGSPVFVTLGHMRPREGGLAVMAGSIARFFLLGMVQGHWNLRSEPDLALRPKDASEFVRINSGIAIVTPAVKILEVLNQKTLADAREQLYREQREKSDLLAVTSFSLHTEIVSPPPVFWQNKPSERADMLPLVRHG